MKKGRAFLEKEQNRANVQLAAMAGSRLGGVARMAVAGGSSGFQWSDPIMLSELEHKIRTIPSF